MKVDLKLPQIIGADDYHEFYYLQDVFKTLNKRIKIKEIEFCDGQYRAIIYLNKQDAKYKKLEQEILLLNKECRKCGDYERYCDCE